MAQVGESPQHVIIARLRRSREARRLHSSAPVRHAQLAKKNAESTIDRAAAAAPRRAARRRRAPKTWSAEPTPIAATPLAAAPDRWQSSKDAVDVALQTIGLALEALLDDTCLPEVHGSSAATTRGAAPDVRGLLLRELFADVCVDADAITVIVEGDHVTLTGTVTDALSRLLVEDLVWSLPSVRACDNRLAVS